jgi:DNA-binding protein H-NS
MLHQIHHAQSRPRTRDEQERLLTKHFLKTHQETPENTWTGCGRTPRWMAAATKAGKVRREDLLA